MKKAVLDLFKHRHFSWGNPITKKELEKFWAKNTMFRLPKEFVALCQEAANGIRGDSVTIYAIYTTGERQAFPSVLMKNRECAGNRVVLGENSFSDILTYNFEKQLFEIVDDANELLASYSSLEGALAYMLT